MDLNQINTVQDLINQNEDAEDTQQILQLIFKKDPKEGLEIVTKILEELEGWHVQVGHELTEKADDSDNPELWFADAGKIDGVLAILKTIAL